MFFLSLSHFNSDSKSKVVDMLKKKKGFFFFFLSFIINSRDVTGNEGEKKMKQRLLLCLNHYTLYQGDL